MTSTRAEADVVTRIDRAMVDLQSTKAEMARVAGRSEPSVNGWFQPKRKTPGTMRLIVDTLNAIAVDRGLNRRWTVAELLGEEPDPARYVVGRALSQPGDAPDADLIDGLAQRVATRLKLLPAGEIMFVRVPCVGRIPCGIPLRLGEPSEMLDVLRDDLPRGWDETCFVGIADGESMAGLGIADGARLFIKPDPDPSDRSVVVVVVDGETTCKRLRRSPGAVVLEPANPVHVPIVVDRLSEIHIVGRVIGYQPPMVTL